MKKKILVVTDVYNWIGHTRANKLQEYLSDEFDIDIMDATEFNEWEKKSDGNIFRQDDFKRYLRFKGGDTQNLSMSEFNNFVVNRKPKRNYDLVYLLFHTMIQKKSVQRIIGSIKVATVVTGYPTLKPCFYRSLLANENYARQKFINLSKKCVAIGANNIKSLEDLRNIYKGDTFYAPRGVDPKVFYPMTTTFEPKEKLTVAYVGKPVPEKGLEGIIKPACEAANVDLILNDRNYENALSPKEMNEFYNQADVYLVSSTIDGTPNPGLEAAACGKPIISNHIGNMPELIKDGVNGFLVKNEVSQYANKLIWMKSNPENTFEMGMKAREAILENWTWEHSMKNKREIFRRLCNVS